MKIAGVKGYEDNLNRFNVIQIDMNSEYQSAEIKENVIKRLLKKIKNEIRKQFSALSFEDDDTLTDMMLNVYSETGGTFIVLIDEYDVLVREEVDEGLFQEYLSFLNALFKSNTLRPAVSLAYITGILPVVRDRVQSKLNNFKEYSILDARELAEYVGFTADEVKALCAEYKVDYEECRRWYDGYRQHGFEIYNPESVVECVTSGYEEAVAHALDASHINVTSNRSYNNEDALQSAIYLAYIYALNEYTVIKEMTAGKGFADVVFIPFKENRPAMIIELKKNHSPESALLQIREKRYFDALSHYEGDLLFIGISYDEKEKAHSCRIERFRK